MSVHFYFKIKNFVLENSTKLKGFTEFLDFELNFEFLDTLDTLGRKIDYHPKAETFSSGMISFFRSIPTVSRKSYLSSNRKHLRIPHTVNQPHLSLT